MKKKFISMILSAIMISSYINVGADFSAKSDFDILNGLDIVCGLEYDTTKAYEVIKKSSFINYALNIITDKKYTDFYDEDALENAQSLGIIHLASDVKENYVLTRNEAITIIVRLLGYEARALELGGYPSGYLAAAAEIGVLKGVTLSDKVTYEEALKILYNTTETDYSNYILTPNGHYISYEYKVNVLERFKEIYTIEGIVSENSQSGLYGESTIGKGYVKINGEVYEEGSSGAGDMLGFNVVAYIKDSDSNGVDEILYLHNKSNDDIVLINSENVASLENNFSEIKYYKDKTGNKVLSESIASDAAFIKNGASYSDVKAEDFYKEGTKITLINNDNDTDYEVVSLKTYDTMLVSSVSATSKKIYNEYSFDKDFAEIDLTKYKEDNVYIYKNGEEVELSEILAGDVLSIYTTPNGEKGTIKIYAQNNAFSGTVESYADSEGTVIINSTEYEVSELYTKAAQNSEKCARRFVPGTKYMFRQNADGKIISAENISNSDYIYGYATKYFYNDDDETQITFRMFMADGTWQNIKLADKVRHNGTKVLKADEILTDYEVLGSIPGLMGIKLNNDGEICVIETPVAYEEDISLERLNSTGEQGVTYRYNDTTFANKYYMTGSTVVFIVPKDEDANESDYRIGNNYSFIADSSYTITGYNRDKFYTLDMVVNKRDTSSIKAVSNTVYMVKSLGVKATQDGDVLPFVNVASDTYAGVTLEGIEGIFEGVKKGDLIKIHINNEGLIDNCQIVYSETDGTEKVLPDSGARNGNSALVKGFALDKEVSGGKILVDTAEEMAFKFNSSKAVLIYDAENKEVSVGSLNDIERDDYLIISLSKSAVSMIAVYKGL